MHSLIYACLNNWLPSSKTFHLSSTWSLLPTILRFEPIIDLTEDVLRLLNYLAQLQEPTIYFISGTTYAQNKYKWAWHGWHMVSGIYMASWHLLKYGSPWIWMWRHHRLIWLILWCHRLYRWFVGYVIDGNLPGHLWGFEHFGAYLQL